MSKWLQTVSVSSSRLCRSGLFSELCVVSRPQISEAVLVSGEQLSRKFRVQNHSPLMYEWYQEQYVGAAHGLAGIYYYLMQVKRGWGGTESGAVLGRFSSSCI